MTEEYTQYEVLKVAAGSSAQALAGALAGTIREHGKGELRAVGASAVNQAVKAIAITRGFMAPAGYDLVCIPAFINVEFEKQERTGIQFSVIRR